MIFITGASRSGTTLLSFMLRRHPSVCGLKELQYFGSAWDPRDVDRRFSKAEAIEAVAMMHAIQEHGILTHDIHLRHWRDARRLVEALPDLGADPASLFATIAHQFAADAGKDIPCEQTPRYIFYANALLDIYPDARIVHLVRDPRAVMASQKMRWRRRQLSPEGARVPLYDALRVWVNYHPYTVARLWTRATGAALALANHPRVTLVGFEDLLRQPEKAIRRLCGELEIEYDAGMLDVAQVNSSHSPTVGGSRAGLRVEAINKWRDVLTPAEVQIVDRACAPLMERFGYERIRQGEVSLLRRAMYGLSYLAHLGGVLLVNPSRAIVQGRALMRPGSRSVALRRRRRNSAARSHVAE